MRKAQVERMKKVNELIEVIASVDHRFFYVERYDRIAKFVEGKTTVFWFEECTGETISITNGNRNKFTHGGTLWRLVNDFKLWILTGSYEEKGYWGLNSIRNWGYSDEGEEKVMAKGREIGFVKKSDKRMRFEDMEKNQYGFYKADECRKTGKPMFGWGDTIPAIWKSKTGCKRMKSPIVEGEEPVGFYRVKNGYCPLYERG